MVKILDCTIRDGGHVNNWDFTGEIVSETYKTAVKSGVDYFEIGYRNIQNNDIKGKFYNCTDEMLNNLISIDANCKLCVMVDIGKFDIKSFIDYNPEKTPVSVVRVAVYPDRIEEAFAVCSQLFEMGYEVFLNLMAISRFEDSHYQLLKKYHAEKMLKALYFADSFGSLYPSDVKRIIEKLRNCGYENLGFHSHNNLQQAFSNTICAIECGVDIVDASVYGIGRCAGNLPIEILTGYLAAKGSKNYSVSTYLSLIEKYYTYLHKKYTWGYNIPYFVSGLFDIHPNYANIFLDLSFEEMYDCAQKIRKECPVYFDKQAFENILR